MTVTRAATRAQIVSAPFEALAMLNMATNPRHVLSTFWGASVVNCPAGTTNYIDDGHILGASGTSFTVNGANVTNFPFTTRPDLQNALKITCSVAKATLAAGDCTSVYIPIEGFYSKVLRWGGSNGVPLVVGLMMLSNVTGNYYVSTCNSTNTASYAQKVSLVAGQEQFVVLVFPPNSTVSTWNNGSTSIGFAVRITLASGTTFQGTVNQWNASDIRCASDQVNFVSSTANTLTISDLILLPQLDGSMATSVIFPADRLAFFERPNDIELLRCQRYFEITRFVTGFYSPVSGFGGAGSLPWRVEKRIAPTCGISTTFNSGINSAFISTSDQYYVEVGFTANTQGQATYACNLTADARL